MTAADGAGEGHKGTSGLRAALLSNFSMGGGAAVCACLFSNPIEVVKTRLQLQGELQRAGGPKGPYRNPFQAFFLIARNEGVRAVQKGIVPAAAYQFCMNSVRLGCYSMLRDRLGISSGKQGAASFFSSALLAAATGATGTVLASPFFLVKVRMQSASSAVQVGTQYAYRGMWDGFRQVVAKDGLTGLYQGSQAAAMRVACGSSVQLATYDSSKRLILETGWLGSDPKSTAVHFGASLVSGLAVVLGMNPMDLVATRIYNQTKGANQLYSGPIDAFIKIRRTEGIRGLYKGAFSHYLRVGPHTTLTFVFFEKLMAFAEVLRD